MLMPGRVMLTIPGLEKLRRFLPGFSGSSSCSRRLTGELREIYRRLVLVVFLSTGERLSPALTEDSAADIAGRLQSIWPRWTQVEDRYMRLDLILEIYLFLLAGLHSHFDELQQQGENEARAAGRSTEDPSALIERRGPEIMAESLLAAATSGEGAGSVLDMQSQLEEFGRRMNELLTCLRFKFSPGSEQITPDRCEEIAGVIFAAVVSGGSDTPEEEKMLRMRSVLEDYRSELAARLDGAGRQPAENSGSFTGGASKEILRSFLLEIMRLKFVRARRLYSDIDLASLDGGERLERSAAKCVIGRLVARLESVLDPAFEPDGFSRAESEREEITADIVSHCLKPVSLDPRCYFDAG